MKSNISPPALHRPSPVSLAHARAGEEAAAWELLGEVLDGKLSIQELSQVQGMRLDEVHSWLRQRQRSASVAFDEHLRQALIRQGADAEALAGPELSASLADVSMIDWIQAIQILAPQAVITVLHGTLESRIWCAQGTIVDAVSGRLRGEAAVYRIAALERGQVVTELREVHRERTIQTSTPWMLLEAARRKDDAARIRRELGDVERPFQCAARGASSRSLNTAEAAVLRMFEEPRRLSDVLEHSALGDVETLAALLGLIRSRHLVESAVGERLRRAAARSRLPALGAEADPLPIPFRWPRRALRPARGAWLGSMLALGSVVALCSWLGARASGARGSRDVDAAGSAARSTYAVAIRARPLDSALTLDGRPLGVGAWAARMPRDGVAHELSISAPGFVTARVFFMDVAPPVDIQLDPLPVPEAERLDVGASLGDRVASAGLPPAPEHAGRASVASDESRGAPRPARTPPARPSMGPAGSSASRAARARSIPFVRVIDAEVSEPWK